ncbi:3-keto-5-aminohexanoate cleavage protein [Bradyrhizobium sp. USDA 3315]
MSITNNRVNWEQVNKWLGRTGLQMTWQPYGLPDIMDPYSSRFSDVEPMPRWAVPPKVAISAAITGAFHSKKVNPNQPTTIEEIRKSAEECILAGAPVVHIHVRDEKGFNVLDQRLFEEVILPLRKAYPKVSVDACLVAVNQEESEEMHRVLKSGLLDAVPINATSVMLGDNMFVKSPHGMIEKTRLTLAAGMIPQIGVYTDGDVDNARRFLIDTGLLEPPTFWGVLPALPGCSPMYDTESMIDGLLRTVRLIKRVDPTAAIMVCAAGRASTYVAVLAMLMGLHVRVGMEDTIWKWPHKDDVIESNAKQFEMVAGVAQALGREIMSPDEYRQLIGLNQLPTTKSVVRV